MYPLKTAPKLNILMDKSKKKFLSIALSTPKPKENPTQSLIKRLNE
jgi:hypothetical protein